MIEEQGTSVSAISKGRLEFLYDGIFAIAMTILVLELKVPELTDRHSVSELGHALAHHAPTFGSYLLSFLMLGIFWSRHNHDYRHFHRISYGMLVMTLIQLATAAFFPFCAAMVGRYPQNKLARAVYVGCVLVLMWSRLATWVVAKRSGTFGDDFPLADYLSTRNRILRGCLFLLALFSLCLVNVL
jgi:uncharacterized membrane protein